MEYNGRRRLLPVSAHVNIILKEPVAGAVKKELGAVEREMMAGGYLRGGGAC